MGLHVAFDERTCIVNRLDSQTTLIAGAGFAERRGRAAVIGPEASPEESNYRVWRSASRGCGAGAFPRQGCADSQWIDEGRSASIIPLYRVWFAAGYPDRQDVRHGEISLQRTGPTHVDAGPTQAPVLHR
jgi:hypothetical protein